MFQGLSLDIKKQKNHAVLLYKIHLDVSNIQGKFF